MVMKSTPEDDKEKVIVEDLIKEFQVLNIDSFSSYLAEIWRDLSLRSDDKSKGINKVTFSKYYDLPGIISERLFAVFDTNKNEYIDPKEFIEGMTILFSASFDRLARFIFDFYDFDKDGFISSEDVRIVLSYVPLNTKSYSQKGLKFELGDFNDRVESQDELHRTLEKVFVSTDYLNQDQFINVIEKVNSDIFFFILIFILEKRPFSNETVKLFDAAYKKSSAKQSCKSPTQENKLIISPTFKSKFKTKTPMMMKRVMGSVDSNKNPHQLLNLLAGKSTDGITLKECEKVKIEKSTVEEVNVKAPCRKVRQRLGELEDKSPQTKKYGFGHVEEEITIEEEPSTPTSGTIDTEPSEDNMGVKYEGYMIKITQTKKMKKLWFKLVCKDIYYYKKKDDPLHKGMHNLSGVYIKEDVPVTLDGTLLYRFCVIYPKKSRYYYLDNEEDYQKWVKVLRQAIDYANLNDLYEIKEKVGKGKFGLVKLGIHKESGRPVAIKIMNKKDMTLQDLELVKTEIDILKISQHPYIIKLYDVFENVEFIYIIMEYCTGGDLFSYIEKRNFKLPEPKAAMIVHKIATAIYYLHTYGIVHRDLKPENILMTDTSDNPDIRLLDFGLSKIIGPNETCLEPFGTLSYVAPEVLLEQPYNKCVDLWSLGVTAYLLLSGCLPFDDEHSEREIARQTIHDPVPYPSSVWKKISQEAKSFVDGLLQKDPSKRMSIKEVLEHSWMNKFNKTVERRKKSQDFGTGSQFMLYATIADDNSGSTKANTSVAQPGTSSPGSKTKK